MALIQSGVVGGGGGGDESVDEQQPTCQSVSFSTPNTVLSD